VEEVISRDADALVNPFKIVSSYLETVFRLKFVSAFKFLMCPLSQ
jgi:hypothetical protein